MVITNKTNQQLMPPVEPYLTSQDAVAAQN